MNRTAILRLSPALLLVPALLLAACGAEESSEGEVAAAGTVDAPLARAERVEVPRTIDLYGTVEADRTVDVSARVMAQITAVHVAAGDTVRRGQTLLEIDPQAALGQVGQARGGLAQAQAALALAQRNYQRYRALAESGAASDLELDMARMEYDRARGAVEQAEGAVAAASSVASDSRVTAPFDGRVVRRMVEVGDLAAPGRPLMMLESGGDRRAALQVPESAVAAAGLAVGSPVELRIDSRPGLGTFTGLVIEMSPGADPMAHVYDVAVALPAASAVATGSAVRAAVPVGTRQTVAVPAEAVIERGGLDLVVVLRDDGGTASRAVSVGAPLPDGRLEVLSGLTGGETLVVGLAAVPPAGTEVRGGELPPAPPAAAEEE